MTPGNVRVYRIYFAVAERAKVYTIDQLSGHSTSVQRGSMTPGDDIELNKLL